MGCVKIPILGRAGIATPSSVIVLVPDGSAWKRRRRGENDIDVSKTRALRRETRSGSAAPVSSMPPAPWRRKGAGRARVGVEIPGARREPLEVKGRGFRGGDHIGGARARRASGILLPGRRQAPRPPCPPPRRPPAFLLAKIAAGDRDPQAFDPRSISSRCDRRRACHLCRVGRVRPAARREAERDPAPSARSARDGRGWRRMERSRPATGVRASA